MRLFSLGCAASVALSVFAADLPPAARFEQAPNQHAPKVCSIPLLSPKPPLVRTPPDHAKILRFPPSNTLDHNQIPPPAPPCGQRSAFPHTFPIRTRPDPAPRR